MKPLDEEKLADLIINLHRMRGIAKEVAIHGDVYKVIAANVKGSSLKDVSLKERAEVKSMMFAYRYALRGKSRDFEDMIREEKEKLDGPVKEAPQQEV